MRIIPLLLQIHRVRDWLRIPDSASPFSIGMWGSCGCFNQLKFWGIPLWSIFVKIASLFGTSDIGWPVSWSIRLRRVCDTWKVDVEIQSYLTTNLTGEWRLLRKNWLTWTTSWLHHKITWCSIDNHTFFMPVLLIIKPCVGGTIPSSDCNFDRT